MLKVKVIIGSTRPGRFSEKFLPWVQAELAKQADFEAEVLDLRDYPMPLLDLATPPSTIKNGEYGHEVVNTWAKKIAEADAYIVITPEYNHGYPAVLKNALDFIYHEWARKPIGFVSYGSAMGARAVEQLRQVVAEMHMMSVRQAVLIPSPWHSLEENGELKEGALDVFVPQLKDMTDQLLWWENALKEARGKTA